jgi:NAD(P)-dependent dehydrogenase (short-subunit alcohol dehydrogenase family)
MELLGNKTVVVSGAGDGLGKDLAELALEEGANVVLGARNAERLAAMADELDPDGKRVIQQPTDITSLEACQSLTALATERFGGIDVLVNCAAYDSLIGGLEGADFQEWRKVLEINFMGTMQMISAAVPSMKERGGSIVNIGSQSMYWPQLVQTAYGASKAALASAGFALAKELGPDRIRVNTVVPSWMWGPEVEMGVTIGAQMRDVPVEEVIGEITKNMPLGEIPTTTDVAHAAMFLASDRARMITGQTLLVNAGEFFKF